MCLCFSLLLFKWSGMNVVWCIYYYVLSHRVCILLKQSRHVDEIFWLDLNITRERKKVKKLVKMVWHVWHRENWSFSNIMTPNKSWMCHNQFSSRTAQKHRVHNAVVHFAIIFNKLLWSRIAKNNNQTFESMLFFCFFSQFDLLCCSVFHTPFALSISHAHTV